MLMLNAGNNFSFRLADDLSQSDLDLFFDIDTTTGVVPEDPPFLLTINNNRENMEIVKAIRLSSPSSFEIERGQEGTTPQNHAKGSLAENNFTAGTYQALVEEIETLKQQAGIAEIGENSNGHYIRYENGIQMCWHEVYNDDNTSASGALYQKQISFTFPKAFVSIPSVSGTARNEGLNYVQWVTGRTVTNTEVSVYVVCTSQDRPGFYGYQAIGRWK